MKKYLSSEFNLNEKSVIFIKKDNLSRQIQNQS